MNYIEWAAEYADEAEKLQGIMNRVKEERKMARGEDINSVNQRLSVLYTMYLECKHTAKLLFSRAGDALA